ncbi:MAG: hypothetical protein DHS20C13_22900 [Thermodesulfobacteriota bacterium]|nr:MAG: hypothetical protein DHS20C13_22900 [Thermodesulfobacteriota bacterium]
MISKLRFSLIAVIMLVLLGFGFQNQAKGQIGLDGLFCPAVPNTTGWLETEIVGSGLIVPDFTGALIGTVESVGGDNVGGLDWHHVDFTSFATPTPTNETGSQLVSWWTLKDTRNTYLQVTNSDSNSVTIHVRIHNEDCVEIRDFCDTYTPNDTHEYNFSDLVTNQGASVNIPGAGNVEGWVVATAVEDCGTDSEQAIEHNSLSGQLIVHDSDDYLYGVNTYARQAVCFDIITPIEINLVENGSFESGALPPWFITQGNAGVIDENGISPSVEPPDGDFQAFLASSDIAPSGAYQGIFIFENATNMLIQTGNVETNVSVIQSNIFVTDSSNTATYDLSFLAPADTFIFGCDNYAAALLYDVNVIPAAVVDAECYSNTGAGSIATTSGNVSCTVASDDNIAYSISPFAFDGGRSNYFAGSLSIPNAGSYAIQFVTGNVIDGFLCETAGVIFNGTNGALVDDVEVLDTIDEFDNCDGTLTGAVNAMLDVVRPDTLAAQFNILPGNASAGADVVHINFADDYGDDGLGPYRPIAAFSAVSVAIFDDFEQELSCGDALVCFVRLGVDDALVNSDDFSPVTPTPTPTITPSITPTAPPTLIPTPTPGGGGGSSSCSIAASPVQLGTALANVLIPLVPVAFAFGVRAVRRRKK